MNIGRGSGTTAGREPVLRRQLVSTSYSPYTLWKYFLCTAVSLNSDFHCCAVSKHPEKPFLLLHRGQSAKFDVIFKPTLAQRLEGRIRVLVGNTYSNKTQIELVGEGHEDEFTLDGLEEDTKERNAKSSLKKDIIDGKRGEAAKLEQGRGKCLIMCVLSLARPGCHPLDLVACGCGSHACRAVCAVLHVAGLRMCQGVSLKVVGWGTVWGTLSQREEGLEQGSIEQTGVCAREGSGWTSLHAEIPCSPP